jgi:hypothetical protein
VTLYRCSKHGLGALVLVCSHLNEAISARNPLKFHIVAINESIVPEMKLCKKCVADWGKIQPETEEEEHFLSALVPVCAGCFQEWKKSNVQAENKKNTPEI